MKAWICAKRDGEMVAAHCLCIAGNGEACSHIAALMFYIECGMRIRAEQSCTDRENSWLPAHIKKLRVRPVAEMDFASAAMKKRRLDDLGPSCSPQVPLRVPAPARAPAPPVSKQEKDEFLGKLISSGLRPAAASTNSKFSELYISAIRACTGGDLRLLYDRKTVQMSPPVLADHCAKIFARLEISEQACQAIEKRTRKQALSVNWFAYRAGRITASTLYDGCHTSLSTPSLSLVKRICAPQSINVSAPPVRYGREHEGDALDKYKNVAGDVHYNVHFKEAGLFVSKENVFLAATPDMLVECDCCGAGVVEVKCPWNARDGHLTDLLADQNSCVIANEGSLELKVTHRYFYQVQAQMYVCGLKYADFVLWNEREINIERINQDCSFILPLVDTARTFFQNILLPELVARRLTENPENTVISKQAGAQVAGGPSTANGEAEASKQLFGVDSPVQAAARETSDTFCVCKGPEEGKMIACDGATCKIKWFHFTCIGLKRAPKKRQWFCQFCSERSSGK